MWIKSQDNKILVNTDNVTMFEVMEIDEKYAVVAVDGESSDSIAYYHTEESAVKVLDKIRDMLWRCLNEHTYTMPVE